MSSYSLRGVLHVRFELFLAAADAKSCKPHTDVQMAPTVIDVIGHNFHDRRISAHPLACTYQDLRPG